MSDLIYLDRYVLQKDMRIRMPKSILVNLDVTKGETMFSIYIDKVKEQIILVVDSESQEAKKSRESITTSET